MLTALAVGGPALWIGGVHPEVVPAFGAIMLALWLRLCARSKEPLRVPPVALIGALLVGVTALQWLPLPGLREALAPDVEAMITGALADTGADARAGLSPTPGDTLLEVSRLTALTFLIIAAAQLSWRVTTMIVAALGTLVATIGLAHEVLGLDAVYGIYVAEHVDRSTIPALLGTFINGNHQSGLFLLGLFCAAALAVDQHILGLTTRDASKAEVYRDRFLAALGAVIIQLPALLLSLSRGAMIAFATVAPVAAILAIRRSRAERKADPRRAQPAGVRLLIFGGLVVLIAIVAQHGAWQELSSLWSSGRLAEDDKITMFQHAPDLIALSPILGTGRGSFIDLYPSVEPVPSYVLSTHLESLPLALLVEWGPAVGGLTMLGLGVWYGAAMWYGGKKADARPRRIALLGLLALAIQQSADFALEFLGVAAPACALAGALSPARFFAWNVARARIAGVVALPAAVALGVLAVPDTWSHRPDRNAELAAGERDAASLLETRALDGTLHVVIARALLEAGDYEAAYTRAQAACELRPGSMEAWLIRSSAAAELGRDDDANASMARALAELHLPLSDELVEFLLLRYPTPASLAAVSPTEPRPWQLLVKALIDRAPEHADAVAEVRAVVAPEDPDPQAFRSRIALTRGHPALALHHARLLHQAAPERAQAYLLQAAALGAMGDRTAEVVEILERGASGEWVTDPTDRGHVEEQLVRVLIAYGDPQSLARAKELIPDLVSRPATGDVRARRRDLAKAVAAKK